MINLKISNIHNYIYIYTYTNNTQYIYIYITTDKTIPLIQASIINLNNDNGPRNSDHIGRYDKYQHDNHNFQLRHEYRYQPFANLTNYINLLNYAMRRHSDRPPTLTTITGSTVICLKYHKSIQIN